MGSARLGVLAVFFLHGVCAGMWVTRVPPVQGSLGFGVGGLGLVLLGGGLGTLAAMVLAGAMIARHGSRAVVRWTAWPAALTLGLQGVAPDGPTPIAALVGWGASMSALNIAMNAQGSTIEQRLGRPIMSSLHGFWSLGNMSGAAVGAHLAGAGVAGQPHLAVGAVILLVALLVAGRTLVEGDAGYGGAGMAWPSGALLAMAVVAFCAVMVERAVFNWGGVYLWQVLAAPVAATATAAGFFSAAMAAGRLGGDHLTARVRASSLARACALLAALGVAAPVPAAVFGGLIAVGLGLSILVPLAFGAAGRRADMPTGAAIAAVATMGYLGSLVGPATLSLVAAQVSLRGASALLLALLAVIALLAPAFGDQRARPEAIETVRANAPGRPLDA